MAGGRRAVDQVTVTDSDVAAAANDPSPQLSPAGELRWLAPEPLRAALSVVARDAHELLTGPLAKRVRVCAAPDCSFLLSTRPGRADDASVRTTAAVTATMRATTAPAKPATGQRRIAELYCHDGCFRQQVLSVPARSRDRLRHAAPNVSGASK